MFGGDGMKARDRVLASVGGEEVLPIPVDVFRSLIFPKLEAGLCRHFGLGETDHEGVLCALGAHTRFGYPAYVGPPLAKAPFDVRVEFPNKEVVCGIWGTWEGMESFSEGFDRPLRSAETVGDIEAHAWPDPDWFDYECWGGRLDDLDVYLPLPQWAEQYSDFARVAVGWSPVFCRIMDLCGMQAGLMNLAARPDLVHAMVTHTGEFLEEYYRRIAQAGQGYIDFLGFGDDFAGQKGMLLSPQSWREYFLPLWERLFATAHEHGMKTWMHACGAVRPVLGDLIDVGLDVLETVQTTAVGMDPAELKREFGAHLTFYGAMDTQDLLPYGTSDDVRREVRRLVDILGKGGRYILTSMHLLMDDVPVENALAMYDEARSYRPDWAARAS